MSQVPGKKEKGGKCCIRLPLLEAARGALGSEALAVLSAEKSM